MHAGPCDYIQYTDSTLHMDAMCVVCSVLSCAPGYRSSGCSFGSVSDAVCVACDGGPLTGPYNWTFECDFECDDGFWFNSTDCAACDVLSCDPGFFSSNCGGTNNSECAACAEPAVPGPTVWTDECNFTCAGGFYGPLCVPCSTPLCFPGSVLVECTAKEDASCLQCDPEPNSLWVGGCEFECLQGYYRFNEECHPCTSRTCGPGTYYTACNATADSSCLHCADIPTGGVWTRGCEYSCAVGEYYFNGSSCEACSTPVCGAGSVFFACGTSSDAGCLDCGGDGLINGSFTWVSDCEYECRSGFFRDGNDLCVPCSSLVCAPGTVPFDCTNVSDAGCSACDPPDGMFHWVDDGLCQYECDVGSFRVEGGCLPCNKNLICAAGFQPSSCGYAEDAKCEPCSVTPYPGAYFTAGCEFGCLNGYYVNSSDLCAPCTTDPCRGGTYKIACTEFSDALCVDCVMPIGSFQWTDGCSFQCSDRYFRDGEFACTRCSTPECGPGTYPVNCTSALDSSCYSCAALAGGGYEWTSGCEFRCLDGYYRQNGACSRCSVRNCGPGMYSIPCSSTADATCAQCLPSTVGSVWTTNCNFQCIEGYYRENASTCSLCSQLACGPGFYAQDCTASADSRCAACANALGTGMVWADGCSTGCAIGYIRQPSGSCALPPPPPTTPAVPRVFAVVRSALVIDNTMKEVCANLAALLRSMNAALALISNNTIRYQTNVTALNDVPCVENVCPQCIANDTYIMVNWTETVAVFDTSTEELITTAPAIDWTNTSRRRLLGFSISIIVISQSSTPVPATQPPPVISSTQLLSALSATAPSTLSVGSIATTVSTVSAGPVTVVVVQQDDEDAFLFFLVRILGVLVLVVVVFVCIAICRWSCCKSAFFRFGPVAARMHGLHNDPIVRMAGRLVVPRRRKYKI